SLLGLLACLNSRLLTALYRALAGETGRILPQVKVATMRLLPLPRACLPGKRSRKWEQLEALAAALLSCGGADAGLDRSIDRLIYDIYGLSPEEIAIVENSYTQGGEALK
ncbi:MAG TPA: hypothetical protein VF221_21820, partial [Chloroflexota bacterium]